MITDNDRVRMSPRGLENWAESTTLVSVKNSREPNKINSHAKLRISFDIQRLFTRKP
jgi:hypothetical protein